MSEDIDAQTAAAVHDLMAEHVHGEAPPLFSPEWFDLDESDPKRSAALWRAGFAWWIVHEPGMPVPREIWGIVDVEIRTIFSEASSAVSGAIDWGRAARDHVPADVLAERRRLPDSRPEDFPGGSVPLWGPSREGAA